MNSATTLKFDSIVTHSIGSEMITEQGHILFQLAWDLDGLRQRIEGNARTIGERFTKYAADVAEGSVFEPPTGYSSLHDIARDAATYNAKHDMFKNLFTPVTGRKLSDVVKELRA